MTQGSPFRLIMAFALPLFIGNIFQQFYNVVDSVVVGRFVGSQALAAVGCSGTPFGFFMTLIQGFTAASSVLISQAYGAGNDIVVRGTEAGDIVNVYTTDGKLVSSTPADGNEMRIGVSNGAVYIVKAGSKTLKIAM